MVSLSLLLCVSILRADANHDKWHSSFFSQAKVAQSSHPYEFIKFEIRIQKKRKEFLNPRSRLSQINDELADIHNVVRKNLDDLLDRGEKLEHAQRASSKLYDESKGLAWGAKKLNMQLLWKQYAPVAGVISIVVLVLYVRFVGFF